MADNVLRPSNLSDFKSPVNLSKKLSSDWERRDKIISYEMFDNYLQIYKGYNKVGAPIRVGDVIYEEYIDLGSTLCKIKYPSLDGNSGYSFIAWFFKLTDTSDYFIKVKLVLSKIHINNKVVEVTPYVFLQNELIAILQKDRKIHKIQKLGEIVQYTSISINIDEGMFLLADSLRYIGYKWLKQFVKNIPIINIIGKINTYSKIVIKIFRKILKVTYKKCVSANILIDNDNEINENNIVNLASKELINEIVVESINFGIDNYFTKCDNYVISSLKKILTKFIVTLGPKEYLNWSLELKNTDLFRKELKSSIKESFEKINEWVGEMYY